MAIYRSDQAQLTFGPEAAAGGYAELAYGNTLASGSNGSSPYEHGLLNHASGLPAGSIQITVDDIESGFTFAAEDIIQINRLNHATQASEIRMVVFATANVANVQTLTLDAPTGFYHANNETVNKVLAAADQSTGVFINTIPGVYDTVDLPDPEMSIEPHYFLGTAAKRNFNRVVSGQQTFSGSIGGFVLLNGKALRFPIGRVVSDVSSVAARTYLSASTKKGDVNITVNSATNLAAGDIIGIDVPTAVSSGTVSSTSVGELRKIVTVASTNLQLDYPLQYDHTAAGSGTTQITEAGSSVYTHTILDTVDLDSISWHAHMRASNETATHDFDRRYFGGKVGSASISAEEGGMLSMSWDGVNFLGMIHNQAQNASSVETPFYSVMQPIISTDVVQPTTEPYYFSQGVVTLFGTEVARLRSFNISVNNNVEPRYYIQQRMGRHRGPTELREQRREYTMSATMAVADSATSTGAANSLFKELLFEGDYGSGKTGFSITLVFTRGTNDTITITIPDDGTAGTGGHNQGAFIRSAGHNITSDNPVQADVDILFRNMLIEVVDGEYYYP